MADNAKGGKPSKGTPADGRLSRNGGQSDGPKPKPNPKQSR